MVDCEDWVRQQFEGKSMKRYRKKYEKPFSKTRRDKGNRVKTKIGDRENVK